MPPGQMATITYKFNCCTCTLRSGFSIEKDFGHDWEWHLPISHLMAGEIVGREWICPRCNTKHVFQLHQYVEISKVE